MANLDDLNYPSIVDMTTDERLELLRQIRLSRRTPTRQIRTPTTKSKPAIKIDADTAAELLKIIGEK